MELSKYIESESVELNRSAIHFADYNPRKLSDESRKTLKRGIKKFGLVGGIVVNKRTGLTVVSGHQRLSVMDELQKFPDNDYRIRVDVIDVDEQQKKEALNAFRAAAQRLRALGLSAEALASLLTQEEPTDD